MVGNIHKMAKYPHTLKCTALRHKLGEKFLSHCQAQPQLQFQYTLSYYPYFSFHATTGKVVLVAALPKLYQIDKKY